MVDRTSLNSIEHCAIYEKQRLFCSARYALFSLLTMTRLEQFLLLYILSFLNSEPSAFSFEGPTLVVVDNMFDEIWQINVTSGQAKLLFNETKPNLLSLTYSSASSFLYWGNADTNTLFYASLITGKRQSITGWLNSTSSVVDLAVDDVSQRLYYADSGKNVISSYFLNTLTLAFEIPLGNSVVPGAIALYPRVSLIYWTEIGALSSIRCANMRDGSNKSSAIIQTELQQPSGLTIDQSTAIMFWCDQGLGRIESSALNGSSRNLLLQRTGFQFSGIAVDSIYVYVTVSPTWQNGMVSEVMRVRRTGVNAESFTSQLFGNLHGIIFISSYSSDANTTATVESSMTSLNSKQTVTSSSSANNAFTTKPFATTTTDQPAMETIIANGSLTIASTQNCVGNDVKPREHIMVVDGQKTWLNAEPLPSGILTRFFMYIGNVKTASSAAQIRLQIWRPKSTNNYMYLLVWETRVTVSLTFNGGALYMWTLTSAQQFKVMSGDHIGWTCENIYCPISYDDSGDVTQFFKYGDNLPILSNTYSFDVVGLGSTWSVAVELQDQTETTSTAATLTTTQPATTGKLSLDLIIGISIGCGAAILIAVIIIIGVIVTKKRKNSAMKPPGENPIVVEPTLGSEENEDLYATINDEAIDYASLNKSNGTEGGYAVLTDKERYVTSNDPVSNVSQSSPDARVMFNYLTSVDPVSNVSNSYPDALYMSNNMELEQCDKTSNPIYSNII